MATGRDILILYNYFLFAHEMNALEGRGGPPACQPISGGAVPERTIMSGMYYRAWIGGLYAVVEGWNGLKLNKPFAWDGPTAEYLAHCQARINSLLAKQTGRKTRRKPQAPEVDETLEDLLRKARHKVFHFEPSYLPGALRDLEMKGVSRRWPKQLHEQFTLFFQEWFRSEREKRRK